MTELDFTADAWYQITGRGWVAAITNNGQLPDKMSPGDLLHRYVRIDENEYWVTGVERQGKSQMRFGLLVRGDKIK